MNYYNRQRPHTFNGGMPPVVAEEKLKRGSRLAPLPTICCVFTRGTRELF